MPCFRLRLTTQSVDLTLKLNFEFIGFDAADQDSIRSTGVFQSNRGILQGPKQFRLMLQGDRWQKRPFALTCDAEHLAIALFVKRAQRQRVTAVPIELKHKTHLRRSKLLIDLPATQDSVGATVLTEFRQRLLDNQGQYDNPMLLAALSRCGGVCDVVSVLESNADGWERLNAAKALAFGGPDDSVLSALAGLADALRDEWEEVRCLAARGLVLRLEEVFDWQVNEPFMLTLAESMSRDDAVRSSAIVELGWSYKFSKGPFPPELLTTWLANRSRAALCIS